MEAVWATANRGRRKRKRSKAERERRLTMGLLSEGIISVIRLPLLKKWLSPVLGPITPKVVPGAEGNAVTILQPLRT